MLDKRVKEEKVEKWSLDKASLITLSDARMKAESNL
jgi:hypothetical protein